MKRIVVLILATISFLSTSAQNKIRRTFTMPAKAEYVSGRVLVKVKEEYQETVSEMAAKNASATIKSVALNSVVHIVKPQLSRFGVSRSSRAQKPNVDISKYFYLSFDRNQNVEDYINQLYSTGYFEIVEPDYKHKVDFVPNDLLSNQQYYLNLIKAYDAWDITQGVDDGSIVIAIIDTGGDLSHPDLSPNLYRNMDEYPPNGIDDDNNGFIDDYQGWDFIGSSIDNLYQADYDPATYGDNDPSINKGGDIAHGTMVGGCASAATNNNIGIAGVGFKTKLLFTKQTGDDQATSNGSEYNVYSAMLYAANLFAGKGIKGIINCSFGGSGQSRIVQDMINHIVLDLNCLIVAAAGNESTTSPSYPAAYDNVLSAAASDQEDKHAYFSNYGNTIDITSPGVGIYTTSFGGSYANVNGTSFSSPITSGAAALVWAKNPTFTAVQVGEQLRVTADADALYTANTNPYYANQLGKGRLDIKRALTMELPSIRAKNSKIVNQNGLAASPGDKAYVYFDFTNYLKSTSSGIQISISTISSAVTISKGTISPGIIGEGATVSNKLTPFELTLKPSVIPNTTVNLLITYSDGIYSDYQYQSLVLNPTFIDIDENLISSSISSIGRIGYQDPENSDMGLGFNFDNNPLLYEMGLIMGTSSSDLLNVVRGVDGSFDQDFYSTAPIKQIIPGIQSTSEVFGQFSNATSAASQALVVDYRSMVMNEAPYDKFLILEYKVKNPTANELNNFYFGIFSDWDITGGGQNDVADWDNGNKMGYVHPADANLNLPFAGIQLLTGSPAYYAIDNNADLNGNPWGLYSPTNHTQNFTDQDKFISISSTLGSGNERLQAGALPDEGANGGDVSHVVSSGPHHIAPGQTITIAFALHAAAKFSDLQTSARYADSLYHYTFQASKVLADTVTVCYGSQAILNASGASKIKWYDSFTGGVSFNTGAQYVVNNLKNDTAFYISNADNSYESIRTPVIVKAKANPKISASGLTTLCQGDTVKLSVASADSTIWSTKQKTNTIKVYTAGKYAVLTKDNTLGCVSKSDTVLVTLIPKPTANFTFSGEMLQQPISFTDQSIDAISRFWDFGDGQYSSDVNPIHTFTSHSNSVKLTVTAANNCSASKIESVPLITAIEPVILNDINVYPNPVAHHDLHIVIDNEDMNQASLVLTNSIGQVIMDRDISTSGTHVELTIPSASLNQGLNFIKLNVRGKMITKKVVKVQ